MFSHVFVGVRDFDRALAFYEPLMRVLGIAQRFCDRGRPWAGWQSHPDPRPLFLIGTPHDGVPHDPGNGQMIAFAAARRSIVDDAYALALANGGTSEGAPGLRPNYHEHYYGAYFRDPDGNKVCVVCHLPMTVISIATLEDAAEILALQKLAYESEARLYDDWSIPPMTQTLASLIAQIKVETVLKALDHETIVGSVRATFVDEICLIGRLFVEPAHQGRGIGTSLLHAVEEMFPDARGFELFTGGRSEDNIRLYTRHGYVVTGSRQASNGVALVVLRKQRKGLP